MDGIQVSLDTINSGAVMDLFGEEFEKLLENIADNNTKADQIRAITIKVSLKPSKDRTMAETKVEVTSKLASTKPHESFVLFSSDGTNVSAFVGAAPHQPELPMSEDNVAQFPKAARS